MRGKDGRYHLVYKTTNLLDGKFYIGKHSTRILEDGYLGSGKHLRRSVKKHGKENLKREVLFYCGSSDEANKKEKEILTDEVRVNPLCLNIAPGGGGGFSSDAHREHFLNSSRTSKLRGTQQAFNIAKKAGETRRQHGTTAKGVNWTGKNHREDTKKKMSISVKGKYGGENNPSFGTCWVTDGVKPVKVKKEDLNKYIEQGYFRGRKNIG